MKELWVEKYRPKTVDGYVFRDANQRKQIEGWISDGALPHLLFSGAPGTGKTTLAKVLLTELEVNDMDITTRNLNKNTKGVVITNIENNSPLVNVLSVNDIIIEVQKNPVKTSSDLKNIVDRIFKKGEKTLLLTVINKNNRRRYLGVKIN